MGAIFRIEHLGDDSPLDLKPVWVAEITGLDDRFGLKRDFLRYAHKDYSQANSIGSRGVYQVYHLEEGTVYEVKEFTSWSNYERYFVAVIDGEIRRVSKADVIQCLKDQSPVSV